MRSLRFSMVFRSAQRSSALVGTRYKSRRCAKEGEDNRSLFLLFLEVSMCGIVGAVAQRNITPILLEGLKRLEYRGYDSCGVALHVAGKLQRSRSTSRVAEL